MNHTVVELVILTEYGILVFGFSGEMMMSCRRVLSDHKWRCLHYTYNLRNERSLAEPHHYHESIIMM